MNNFQLWCRTNAKQISKEEFERITGSDFHEFYKKNHRYCLSAWRSFISLKKTPPKKKIPQYILWKEQSLKDKLRKIKELKNNY